MTPAMCGGCGGKTFSVALAGRPDTYNAIEIACTKCGSISVLRVTTPKIQIEWGDGAEGILCPTTR